MPAMQSWRLNLLILFNRNVGVRK